LLIFYTKSMYSKKNHSLTHSLTHGKKKKKKKKKPISCP